MDFEKYSKKIVAIHPEFSEKEIIELCEEYVSRFNRKTKSESKIRSLEKWLSKEFMLDTFSEEENSDKNGNTITSHQQLLDRIPKKYFQSNKKNIDGDWLLRIHSLNKQLGKTILFEDTSLGIKSGEKIAIVGKNGSGKSTLLKIIIGKEPLETGEVNLAKNTRIGFLSQDIFWESKDCKLKDEMLTTLPKITKVTHRLKEIEQLLDSNSGDPIKLVEEQQELINFLIREDGYQKYALQTEILLAFGFTEEQLNFKISQLSGGEQTKVQIAKFLLQEVDFLILDEPTNHLDIEGLVFLEAFCRMWGKTLLCISHDKYFINSVFDQIIEINGKKLSTYHGNYDSFIEQKEANYLLDLKKYKDQQKYLKQQNKFIEKFRYKDSKAKQVQSRIKLLDKMEKIEEPEQLATEHTITFKLNKRLPNLVAKCSNLAIGYTTPLITCPKEIEITKEMKIGVIGRNGIGKTTLIKTLLGELAPLHGEIFIHPNMKIGSYSQSWDNLDGEKSIIDTLIGPGISHKEVRSLLGSLLISNEKMDQKIKTLSGGEKAKVALTQMLLAKPDIIVMDEPTNHLDIDSKEVIKAMLEEFDGVSIIVSHDRDFLEGVSNILWILEDKQLGIYHNIEKGFTHLQDHILVER